MVIRRSGEQGSCTGVLEGYFAGGSKIFKASLRGIHMPRMETGVGDVPCTCHKICSAVNLDTIYLHNSTLDPCVRRLL